MALGRAVSTVLDGIEARIVTVEANVGAGLPGMYVVGLGDTTVRESKDRVRTAVVNSGLEWPRQKIVVNLSPADVPKRGAHLDVAVCLAVLSSRNTLAAQRLHHVLVLGELSLDGTLRAVSGIVPSVLAARRAGMASVIVPTSNALEAASVGGVRILCAQSLGDVWRWALGIEPLTDAVAETSREVDAPQHDFADLAGQPEARWAAEVAAAGAHHLFIIGPPGSGKSMLAERIPGILPPMNEGEALEVGSIRSILGVQASRLRPLAAPHHTITPAGLLGGGGVPKPGAVTVAHHGVLFIDEVSEIPARVLDVLRTPLDQGHVSLRRGTRSVVFPARFQLVLAANPCACAAEEPSDCRCSAHARRKHLTNLSGPLLDRVDITVRTTGMGTVLSTAGAEPSATIAARVLEARERAARRWQKAGIEARANGHVDGAFLRRQAPADEAGMALLQATLASGELTQRGVDRTLRLAWTIADLNGTPLPNLDDVARALELRTAA